MPDAYRHLGTLTTRMSEESHVIYDALPVQLYECPGCGAAVSDRAAHSEFHERTAFAATRKSRQEAGDE